MRLIQRFCIYALLALGSITFIIPLLWMISTGLKPIDQTMSMPPTWLPYRLHVDGREVTKAEAEKYPVEKVVKKVSPRWDNFAKAIQAMKVFPTYLKNTLILCLLTVTGTVLSSSLAAYGFSRIDWRGRN